METVEVDLGDVPAPGEPLGLRELHGEYPHLLGGPGSALFVEAGVAPPAGTVARESGRRWRYAAFLLDCGPAFVVLGVTVRLFREGAAARPDLVAGLSDGAVGGLAWLGILAVYLVCFALPEAWFGWTPGKLVLGMRVVDEHCRPPGLVAAAARNLTRPFEALAIASVVLGGFVFGARSERRLGDRLAGTWVVDA